MREECGGKLPPDAVLCADNALPSPTAEPTKKASRSRPRSERFAILNALVDFTLAGLTGSEAKTWLILFRDTKRTGMARTGQADIARRAGLSRRGVQLALDALCAKGLVDVVRRGRLNAGPSTYRVHAAGND